MYSFGRVKIRRRCVVKEWRGARRGEEGRAREREREREKEKEGQGELPTP